MENNYLDSTKQSVKYWWVSLIVGLLAIGVGIMASAQPIVTLTILTVIFIANFLVSGVFDIFFAISNRNNISGWGWPLAGGIISVIFAIILLALPIESMLVFIFYIGFFVMFQSVSGMAISFQLKKIGFKDWGWLLAFAIFGFILALVLVLEPAFAVGFITILFSLAMTFYGVFRIYYAFKLKKIKNMFEN